MEVPQHSTNDSNADAGSRITPEDAEKLTMICGQLRMVAGFPGAHPMTLYALKGLEELREKVTPPDSFRSLDTLGDEELATQVGT